jgi:hypothetical protein
VNQASASVADSAQKPGELMRGLHIAEGKSWRG